MFFSRKIRTSRNRCNLVHVINSPFLLAPIFGGQVGYMRERGLRTHFVTAPGEQLDKFARDERVLVREENISRTISPIMDAWSVFCIWRWLRKIRPTILHAHTPKGGLIGMLAAVLARVPVRVYHIHGLPFETSRGVRRCLLWLVEWFSCRAAHRVLCVSHSMREIAIRHGICPAEKIAVLSGGSANGIDAKGRFIPKDDNDETRSRVRAQLGIPDDAKVIGFVGRLNRDKGVIELAEAWHRVREQYPNSRLLLAGPREHEDAVPQEVFDRFDADPRVHLTGYQADTVSLYAVMDVFTLPSYREGLPTVVLEAMAMALPIVATRIPGCVDAVEDGVTGTLIDPQNEVELTDAVIAYLENPFLGQQHGRAARTHVLEHFSRERIWQATLDEYRELLATRAPDVDIAIESETEVPAVRTAA